MKTFVAFLMILGLVDFSTGTLKSLSPKTRTTTIIQPVARYRTVNILTSPEPVPIPVLYSSPASSFTTHVSTHNALPTYTVSVPTYVTTYTAAAPVYVRPVTYTRTSYIPYSTLAASYAETFPLLDESVFKEYYSRYGQTLKH